MAWAGGYSGHGGRTAGNDSDEVAPRVTSDRILLSRLFGYLKTHRKDLVYVSVLVAIFTVATVVGPILVGDAIDWYIFPDGVLDRNVPALGAIVGAFVVVNVVMYASEALQTFYMARAGQGVVYTLRREAFDKLQRVSPKYLNDRPIGAVISHVTNDVDVLNDFLAFQSTQLLSGFFATAGIIVVMFVVNVDLSLYPLTIVPLLFLLILSLQGRMKANWMNTRRSMGAVTAKVAESLAGIKVTQSFAAEDQEKEGFDETNQANLTANVRAARLSSFVGPMAQVILSLGIFAVFYFGATMVVRGTIQIGILAAFYIWLNNLFRPVQQLTQFYPQYQSALTGLDRVLQIIDAEVDVREAPDAIELATVAGAVDFDHVSFRYKQGEPNATTDVNVHVAPKEIVAIVGETGAGKTTFVNLLFRFYDPDEGRILIDGHDVRGVTFRSLRKHMAIVLQDPFLFSSTVMENIRYGRLDATDEQVIEAAKQVGLHDFVAQLPQGYGTVIAESATNVSTGQKQLLSLARALIADPRILVLDEATSKVDPHTELLVQKALGRVFSGRTTFIIAHRLSTIRMADRILVLDHGRVIEQGSRDELLRKKGVFARLHAMQFSEPVSPRARS